MTRPSHTATAALTADPAASSAGIAVAVLASDLGNADTSAQNQAPAEILLMPAGQFQARDGRPANASGFWHLDEADAQRVIAAASQAVGDSVIDYEHQTLNAKANGQPAPAAGWFKDLEWRPGSGLWAKVRWTAAAATAIANGEYRYISPVFAFDQTTGHVKAMLMAALTNFPALDGHSDLAAAAAARFHLSPEDHPVNEKQLAALRAQLKLPKDADVDAINTAITALTAKADAGDSAVAALQASTDQLATLKSELTTAGTPDPALFVPRAVYDEAQAASATAAAFGEVAALTALIKDGMADGRIPGQQTADWLKGQGLAACKAYLDTAPAITALSHTQTGGQDPDAGGKTGKTGKDALSEADFAVCKQMGIDPDDYAKHLETAQ